MFLGLRSAPDIGAVGCRLLNPDSTVQMNSVQRFPNISNQLFGIEWAMRRWPKLRLWGVQALLSVSAGALDEVEVVSGACLMTKQAVFERVNGFSTEYFMYAEEADLCYKIRHAGWKVCHVSDAKITHFGGQSTQKRGDAFSDIAMREAVFKFLRKFRGDSYAWRYRAALLLSATLRLAVLTIASPLPVLLNCPIKREVALRTFRKWGNIAKWSLAMETWGSGLGES
jgi:GT2 family glycosyltransferase